YEQYVIGTDREPIGRLIDNRTFRAILSVRGNVPWKLPAESDTPVYLFRTAAPGGVPNASGALVAESSFVFENLPVSDDGSREPLAAALRLTLSEPAFGFGDELYAPNVFNAVQPVPSVEAPPRRRFCRLFGLIGLSPATVDT